MYKIPEDFDQPPIWAGIEFFAFSCRDKDRDEVIRELVRLEGSIFIEDDSFEEKKILLTIDILKMMSDKEFTRLCQNYSIRSSQGEIDYKYLNGIS
jgi:hypothetical protein